MTRSLFARAAIAVLVLVALFGVFLSAPLVGTSYAQEPTAAPTEQAAPAEAAAPSCDAKMQINCSPNSGDTAWMLTSVALVLMMTIPGLGLFYGGMVRKNNVGDTIMTSFAITSLITVLFVCITYSLAFTGGTPFIGGSVPVHAGGGERHCQGHRQSQLAGADDF